MVSQPFIQGRSPAGDRAVVDAPLRVVVLGAGSVGCYLGGLLAGRVREVVLVGRASLQEEFTRSGGLSLSDYRGRRLEVPRAALRFTTEPSEMAGSDVILVTVKATGTEEAARLIAAYAAPATTIISLQNGVQNADLLRATVGQRPVLAGMVSFNIVREAEASFHQATSGPVVFDVSAGPGRVLARVWREAGLEVVEHGDMRGVQWSKLLFNLNNALAALSGLPLRDELSDRGFRRLLAASIREGLEVMRAAGIAPVRLGRMMPRLASRLLPLPTWLFSRFAGAMVRIDPRARSSMFDDLERRRPTEIDVLQGEVERLGGGYGIATPVNTAIATLVREVQGAGAGSPQLSAAQIWARVEQGR